MKLRDILFDFASKPSQIKKRNASFINCVKRMRSKRDLSSDDLKSLLKVSEYVILTSKNKEQIEKEKENVVSKINFSLKESCKSDNKQILLIGKIVHFSFNYEIYPIIYFFLLKIHKLFLLV